MARTRVFAVASVAKEGEPSLRREPKGGGTGSPERRYEPSGGYGFRWKSKDLMPLDTSYALLRLTSLELGIMLGSMPAEPERCPDCGYKYQGLDRQCACAFPTATHVEASTFAAYPRSTHPPGDQTVIDIRLAHGADKAARYGLSFGLLSLFLFTTPMTLPFMVLALMCAHHGLQSKTKRPVAVAGMAAIGLALGLAIWWYMVRTHSI